MSGLTTLLVTEMTFANGKPLNDKEKNKSLKLPRAHSKFQLLLLGPRFQFAPLFKHFQI